MSLDKRVDRLAKAKRAERFAYAVQDFDDSPDYFVGGASLADAKQVSATNPFMARVRVGPLRHPRLQERAGQPLQAASSIRLATSRGASIRWSSTCTRSSRTACTTSRCPPSATTTTPRPSPRAATSTCSRTSSSARASRACQWSNPSSPRCSRSSKMGLADPGKVGIVGHSWGGFDSVVPGDAYRDLRGRSRRRADHRSRQQLRQPSLVERHRRDRSHRDRPAAHAGARSTRICRRTSATRPSTRRTR